MATVSKTAPVTFDDFCLLVKDGQKADLIDGVIFLASPDNIEANRLNRWLCTLMSLFVGEHGLGEVFVSRVAYRLDDTQAPEPDLGFVRTERAHVIASGRVDGPPDLAVEIVSSDSVDRDYEKKRAQYERYGVEEYWIIDPLEQQVTLLRLQKNGRYKQVRPKKGVLYSVVLSGFYLRPEWCWQDPLPKELDLYHEMVQ